MHLKAINSKFLQENYVLRVINTVYVLFLSVFFVYLVYSYIELSGEIKELEKQREELIQKMNTRNELYSTEPLRAFQSNMGHAIQTQGSNFSNGIYKD